MGASRAISISDELSAFITSGLSIILGSRNTDNVPSVARGRGCVLTRKSRPVLCVFVSASEARQVVADVTETGTIAVNFSLPSTHRTIQFKGRKARVRALQPHEPALIAEYREQFADHLEPLGFSREFTRAFLSSATADELALEFTPTDVFQQTPGPHAGERLS